MGYKGQNRSPQSLTHNAAAQVTAFSANVPASEAVGTVLDSFTFAQDTKILKVGVALGAIVGTAQIQLVVGSGAPGANSGKTDTKAAAGDTVFAALQNVTATAAAGQLIPPANRDAIYPAGTTLTLRAVTPAGDTVTGLKITLLTATESAHNADTAGVA